MPRRGIALPPRFCSIETLMLSLLPLLSFQIHQSLQFGVQAPSLFRAAEAESAAWTPPPPFSRPCPSIICPSPPLRRPLARFDSIRPIQCTSAPYTIYVIVEPRPLHFHFPRFFCPSKIQRLFTVFPDKNCKDNCKLLAAITMTHDEFTHLFLLTLSS